MSMLAAILFLEKISCTQNFGKGPGQAEMSLKGRALLTVFLTWPRQGENDIAFALPQSGCEMLLRGMVVDRDSLEESDAENYAACLASAPRHSLRTFMSIFPSSLLPSAVFSCAPEFLIGW